MKFIYFLVANIISLCLITTEVNAQQDTFGSIRLLEVYNKEVISYGTTFIKDNQKLKFKEVRTLLLNFPDLSSEYLKHRKKRNAARIVALSTGVLLGLAISDKNADIEPHYAYALGGIGLGITGAVLMKQSYSHLQNSIWLYNRDVLLEKY